MHCYRPLPVLTLCDATRRGLQAHSSQHREQQQGEKGQPASRPGSANAQCEQRPWRHCAASEQKWSPPGPSALSHSCIDPLYTATEQSLCVSLPQEGGSSGSALQDLNRDPRESKAGPGGLIHKQPSFWHLKVDSFSSYFLSGSHFVSLLVPSSSFP